MKLPGLEHRRDYSSLVTAQRFSEGPPGSTGKVNQECQKGMGLSETSSEMATWFDIFYQWKITWKKKKKTYRRGLLSTDFSEKVLLVQIDIISVCVLLDMSQTMKYRTELWVCSDRNAISPCVTFHTLITCLAGHLQNEYTGVQIRNSGGETSQFEFLPLTTCIKHNPLDSG